MREQRDFALKLVSPELPVTTVRRGCLYDHALELHELLSGHEGAGQVSVQLPDEALELLDTA